MSSVTHRIQKMRHPNQLSRNRSTVKAIHRLQIRGSEAAPAKAGQVADLSTVFEAFQRKYNLDAGTPLWKRVFFRWIYLPFNRFCFFKLRLIPPDHVVCRRCGDDKGRNGTLGWLERQGVFSQKWRAEQEAEKYAFGGVEPLAFDTGEQDCTCQPRSIFPNSTARWKYERGSQQTVSVEVGAMQRLKNVLMDSGNGT